MQVLHWDVTFLLCIHDPLNLLVALSILKDTQMFLAQALRAPAGHIVVVLILRPWPFSQTWWKFQWPQMDCAVRALLAHALGKDPEKIRARSKPETFHRLRKQLLRICVSHTAHLTCCIACCSTSTCLSSLSSGLMRALKFQWRYLSLLL